MIRPGLPAVKCLEENSAQAFAEAQLDAGSRAKVEAHARECSKCHALIVVALQGATGLGQSLVTQWLGPTDGTRTLERAPDQTRGGPTPLAPGARIARYTLLGLVGRGGMGEVYAAYDPDLDRRVALKLVHPDLAMRDARARERHLREAQVTAKLVHPNVVVVHDVGEVEGRVFIAMEFVDGVTLSVWLSEKPRPWREIVDVFIRAGRGLSAAHRAGIVHRDFKPQNVMVGADGIVRVMDFGLARRFDAHEPAGARSPGGAAFDATLTLTGEQVGTPLYMAPEQLAGSPVDARGDQFSFCVSLYWALFGTHPFGAGAASSTADIADLPTATKKASVPAWIHKTLLRGLSVEPAARWPSIDALIVELQRDPLRKRRRMLAISGVALIGVVAAASAFHLIRQSRSVCSGGPDRWADVWEGAERAGPSSRRDRVKAAILSSGTSEPERVWERTASLLDRYAEKWIGAYRDACEATHVRGDQSEEVLDLRMTCLSDNLDSVRALTELLSSGDRAVIDHAVETAGSLGDVARCGAAVMVRSNLRPPRAPLLRQAVELARRRLKEGQALSTSGQYERATTIADGVLARADLAAYCPVVAEAMLLKATAGEEKMGRIEIPLLERTVAQAERCGHDRIVATALTQLVYFYSFYDLAAAERSAALASAVLEREGSDPVIEAWLVNNVGALRFQQGRFQDARREFERSLEMKEKLLGADHFDVALAISNLSMLMTKAGQFDDALATARRARAMLAKWMSDESVYALNNLSNEAHALLGLGRLDEAEADLKKAIEAYDRRFPREAPYRLEALSMLASVRMKKRDFARALPAFEEVLEARERSNAVPSDIAQAQFELAVALDVSRYDRPRSLELAHRALETFASDPLFGEQRKQVERFLAELRPAEKRSGSGRESP